MWHRSVFSQISSPRPGYHHPQPFTLVQQAAGSRAHCLSPQHQFLLSSHHCQSRTGHCQECTCEGIPLGKPCVQKTSGLLFGIFWSKLHQFHYLRCDTSHTSIPCHGSGWESQSQPSYFHAVATSNHRHRNKSASHCHHQGHC